MRMEGTKIGFEPGGENGFLDALVQLEQMRMAIVDADPDDFRPTFAGESPKADEREEERFPGNRAQFFHERFLGCGRNGSKKTERQMHLPRLEPAHAGQMRI